MLGIVASLYADVTRGQSQTRAIIFYNWCDLTFPFSDMNMLWGEIVMVGQKPLLWGLLINIIAEA